MKLAYPLLLKDKLVDVVEYHAYTKGFCDELKEKVIQKCIDLWLYIADAQEKQYNHDPKLKDNLKRKGLTAYDEGVPIMNTTLSRRYRIHRHLYYNHLLTILKDIDVIEVGDWYRVQGEKEGVPKSYKIKRKVIEGLFGDFVWMEPTNPADKYLHKSKQDWIRAYPEQKNLIENHYLTHINLKTLEYELKGLVMIGELNQTQYFCFLNQSLKFNQRFFYFVRKDGRGRFYSSFSTLPKIVRKHITIDGSFVCEIDLKNALPLFISYKIDNKDFRKDCLEGIFWDKVSKYTNIEREVVKKSFMSEIVYNKTERKTKLYVGLEELYPGLYEKIDEIKSRGDMFEKYTDLESKIFVDGMKTFDFPYLSIHDCIVVRNRERDRNRAIQALNYVFVDKGLELPTFGVKCV